MSRWKLAIAIVLLCAGAAAVLYSANTMAFCAWLSAHPNYDDALWGRRADMWLCVTVVLLCIETAGLWRTVVLYRRGKPSPVGD
jgi:hypothetical protein